MKAIIQLIFFSMNKQYYRAIFERNHGFLLQSTKGALPKLMNIQMELRKCCNHPFLIAGVEEKEMDELESKQENVASTREQRVKELTQEPRKAAKEARRAPRRPKPPKELGKVAWSQD